MYGQALKRIHNFAVFSVFLAIVVVMLGAWTRLVDAGLGCPDWPGCYGFLTVPETPEKIAIAEMRYPEAPVEADKGWPEMIHRYFASTLGFVLLCLAAYTAKIQRSLKGRATHDEGQGSLPSGHVYGLLALVILQGMFGMWTVTLKLWPQVVSLHLLGGFATLSLLFLLVLRTKDRTGEKEPHEQLHSAYAKPELSEFQFGAIKRFALVGLLLVVLQIFLGAWTASNYAALACGNELPGCQGSLWPEMNFGKGFNLLQEVGPNYLGGTMDNESRVAIQVAHRIGALVLTAYLLWLALRIWRCRHIPVIRNAVIAMVSILAAQLVLGLSNVILLIPLSIAVAHNAVGALLLLSMVNLNFHLNRFQK